MHHPMRVRFATHTLTSHYSSSSTSLSEASAYSAEAGLTRHAQLPASTSTHDQSYISLPGCSSGSSSNSLTPNGHHHESLQYTQSYPPHQQAFPAHPHHQPAYHWHEHPCEDLGSSISLYINAEGAVSHVPTNTKARTTLYRNGSVSIVNCEYKLREKYPHLVTLIFYMLFYIASMVFIASLFVMCEKNEEMKVRDQILNTQQQFLERNPCVDPKSLRTFVKAVLSAADMKVNLAKLNNLVEVMTTRGEIDIVSTGADVGAAVKADSTVTYAGKTIGPSPKTPAEITGMVVDLKGILQRANDGVDERTVGKNRAIEIENVQQKKPLVIPTDMANWEFSSSLIFVTTVVTTIGYGHIAPITPAGKLLAIISGAIAIPMTLLVFSILVSMFRDGPIKLIEIWLIKMFARFSSQSSLLRVRFVHLFLVTAVLFSLLILGPAFFFDWMEPEWSLLDSFYYCFITITTVGLGDFVPGQNKEIENRALYQFGIVIYMYVSLCMVLLWIALVLRIPYFNFKTFLVIEEPEISEEHQKLLDEEKRLAAAAAGGSYGYGSTESLLDSYENELEFRRQQNRLQPLGAPPLPQSAYYTDHYQQ